MNPFAMLYDALWTLALSSASLSALVKVGNRIRYDDPTKPGPNKETVQIADLPELQLLTDGVMLSNVHASSCTANVARRYTFILSTGDKRLTGGLFDVEWALFCALTDWQTVLRELRWQDKRFVTRLDVTSVVNGMSDPVNNRGLSGWSALWSCEVECTFNRALLAAELSA